MIDSIHALSLCLDGKRAGKVGAEFVGRTALGGVEALGALEGLLEQAVAGMGWIVKALPV